MVVAFDNSSESTTQGTTSITLSHTCTGSDLILLVAIHCADTIAPTGVTYNSVPMTLVHSENTSVPSSVHLYKLSDPATGANDIVSTFASGTNHKIGAVSLTGTNGTTEGLQISLSSSTTPNSVTVTSKTDDMVFSCIGVGMGVTPSFLLSDGQTQRYGGSASGGAGSTKDGASSVVMSYYHASDYACAQIAVNIPQKISTTPTQAGLLFALT